MHCEHVDCTCNNGSNLAFLDRLCFWVTLKEGRDRPICWFPVLVAIFDFQCCQRRISMTCIKGSCMIAGTQFPISWYMFIMSLEVLPVHCGFLLQNINIIMGKQVSVVF